MEILFNSKGVPLMMSCSSAFLESTGLPSDIRNELKVKSRQIMPYDDQRHLYVDVDGHKVVSWGTGNMFPQLAVSMIRITTVLNTGLKFIRNFTMGQGIFPCIVEGYDDNGNEVLKPYTDKKVTDMVNSRQTRRMMEAVVRDYLKVGCSAVQFVPNQFGEIVGLNAVNSMYFRHTKPDEQGNHSTIISGWWPQAPAKGEFEVLPALNEFNPELQVDILKRTGKMKKGFIMPVRDSWSNDDIYSEPIWLPAFLCGWVEIAHMVPTFLKKAYKNQITWKWHVQIPYSYWDKKYPEADYKDPEARKNDIQREMDNIERSLCGIENAEKPMFTHYAVNDMNGKIEEEWKITALDNKYKGGDNLVTSAAANSEILFAIMVNPNVLGAGMPGGTYAGNQGGSNIREAFLVNIANAWIDRQNILDPLQLLLHLQGVPSNVQLRFRNTVLTTLDTGAGTKKTLS